MSAKLYGKAGLVSSDPLEDAEGRKWITTLDHADHLWTLTLSLQIAKKQLYDAQKKMDGEMIERLSSIVSLYMSVNKTTVLDTNSIRVEFEKQSASSASNLITLEGGGSFSMPSNICSIYMEATGSRECTNDTIITLQVACLSVS